MLAVERALSVRAWGAASIQCFGFGFGFGFVQDSGVAMQPLVEQPVGPRADGGWLQLSWQ
jgi:hypothetical protein